MNRKQGDGTRLLLRAAIFAAHKHREQRRKDAGATPYINHPLAVAAVLAEEGGVRDPELLAAALLHDTLEDTETSCEELRGRFGERIAGVVAEVTDTKFLRKRARKPGGAADQDRRQALQPARHPGDAAGGLDACAQARVLRLGEGGGGRGAGRQPAAGAAVRWGVSGFASCQCSC